jgi:hypothetical protein
MIAENHEMVARPALEKGGFQSLHANTNPWVEITGSTTALGRVYLIDLILGDPEPNKVPIVWLGVYEEAYSKFDGEWRISRSSLQFMWPKRHLTPDFPGKHLPTRD